MEKMNVLSPELSKIVNDARPKPGQVIYFASLRPQGGGTSVRNTDRIFDPFVKNEDGSKGAYTDIGYVTGQDPARGDKPAQYRFGRIQFTKSSFNIMGISGKDRGQDTLFLYLFLCNYNKNNIGKDWYAPSENQSVLFEMQVPEKSSADKNAFRRKVRMAGEKIDGMPESKLVDFALALELPRITQFSKMEEIRDRLYEIAEKNPDKVMGMDKDVTLNMKLFIKEALKYGLWEEDKALKLFRWPETKEPVFLMTPGQDLYAETIKYLLNTGEDTYDLVKNLIDKRKEKEKKTAKPKQDGVVGDAVDEARQAGDNAPDKKFAPPKFQEVSEG